MLVYRQGGLLLKGGFTFGPHNPTDAARFQQERPVERG